MPLIVNRTNWQLHNRTNWQLTIALELTLIATNCQSYLQLNRTIKASQSQRIAPSKLLKANDGYILPTDWVVLVLPMGTRRRIYPRHTLDRPRHGLGRPPHGLMTSSPRHGLGRPPRRHFDIAKTAEPWTRIDKTWVDIAKTAESWTRIDKTWARHIQALTTH